MDRRKIYEILDCLLHCTAFPFIRVHMDGSTQQWMFQHTIMRRAQRPGNHYVEKILKKLLSGILLQIRYNEGASLWRFHIHWLSRSAQMCTRRGGRCIQIIRNGGSTWQFVQNMEIQRKAMFQPYLQSGWEFEWT